MNNTLNVLIIEDEEIVLEIFSRILGKYYNVFSCKSVAEFERYKNENVISLFVIDLSLGSEKDGIQLIKELRSSSNYVTTPIMVVTAHAFNQDERTAMKAGATKFLRKPVENDLLVLSAKELLGN